MGVAARGQAPAARLLRKCGPAVLANSRDGAAGFGRHGHHRLLDIRRAWAVAGEAGPKWR